VLRKAQFGNVCFTLLRLSFNLLSIYSQMSNEVSWMSTGLDCSFVGSWCYVSLSEQSWTVFSWVEISETVPISPPTLSLQSCNLNNWIQSHAVTTPASKYRKQDRQYAYNVTMRRVVRVTIVGLKSSKYYTFCVFIALGTRLTMRKSHIVTCALSSYIMFFTLSHKRHDFRKNGS
jgi:hypothetical protein